MKKVVRIFKVCFLRLKDYKINFCISFILSLLGVILGIIEPFFTARIINNVISADWYNLKQNIVKFLLLFFCSLLLSVFSSWYKIKWTKNFNMNIKNEIVKKMLSCPPYYYRKIDDGYVMNVVLEDTISVGEYVDDVGSYLMNIITIVISVVVMIKINIFMSICALVWFPIIYITNRILAKKLNRKYVQIHKLSDGVLDNLKEIVGGVHDIVCNNMLEGICSRLYQKTEKTKDRIVETESISILLDYFCKTVVFINNIVLFMIGCLMIIRGKMSGENFLVFYSFSMSLNTTLKEIAMMFIGIQNSFVSIERFFDFEKECDSIIDREKELKNIPEREYIEQLSITEMSFSFNDRNLLNNVNIDSSRGKIVGIVGENGTGKTTILKLIMKIYKSQLGEIKLGNYNLKDISFDSIRQNITYVTPEPIIYEGSVLENMKLASSKVYSEDIDILVKIFNFKNDLEKLPKKMNTVIDRNFKLSTGQKKKIQLIRCLLRNTSVFLFDEPTIGLDEITKNNFRVLLRQIKKDKIIFIISHDQEDLKLCDNIIQLEKYD